LITNPLKLIKLNFKMNAPSCCLKFFCCCCCKLGSNDKIFMKARKKFRREIGVVNVIQEIRTLKKAIKEMVPSAKWKETKKKASTRLIFNDEDQI